VGRQVPHVEEIGVAAHRTLRVLQEGAVGCYTYQAGHQEAAVE
jgi:hypothetical protein